MFEDDVISFITGHINGIKIFTKEGKTSINKVFPGIHSKNGTLIYYRSSFKVDTAAIPILLRS
jgi:hypothetical protein